MKRKFRQGCQNCILRVQANNVEIEKSLKGFLKYKFFFHLEQELFVKVVKTAFYLSRRTRWEKKFEKKYLIKIFVDIEQNIFGLLAKIVSHVRQNCIMRIQRIMLGFLKNLARSLGIDKFHRGQ